MRTIEVLRNPIRHYAWGSRTALAALQERPAPTPEPEAELWMGAHPRAPSLVEEDGRWTPLPDLIARSPTDLLGREVVERLGPELPFLLKVLAAEQPLSIQAHPDAEQARAGFAREEAAGVPLDAPERSYPDPRPKPELLCALEPFRALCGFRPPSEARERLEALGGEAAGALCRALEAPAPAAALRALAEQWIPETKGRRREGTLNEAALGEAAARADTLRERDPAFAWVARLAVLHPGDPGILAPLVLNLVELAPGEAIFLGAGELHAYLEGTGIEIMASSDNVLRGGLTPKHVDRDELLRVLRFEVRPPTVLRPQEVSGVAVYPTPAAEFELSRITVTRQKAWEEGRRGRVAILLCTEGEVALTAGARGAPVRMRPGTAVLAPASSGALRAEGFGVLFRATVPG